VQTGPARAYLELGSQHDIDAATQSIQVDQHRCFSTARGQSGSQATRARTAAAAQHGDDAFLPVHAGNPALNGHRRNRPGRPLWTSAWAIHRPDQRAAEGSALRILDAVPRSAAFFDLDKTIIAKSSTLAFGRPFYQGGLINRRAVVRSAYAQFVFALSGADEDQMKRMRQYLTGMCTGWDVQQIRDIVTETLHEIIDPIVYNEAVDLITEHKAHGRDVVVVSSSGSEVVGPIAEMVGADASIATRMVEVDGRYTGEIEYYAFGSHKADAIRQLAERAGYDLSTCYAYSDSSTDLPMLEAVGHPVAVNPDRALRREALTRGWPVLAFSNAVPLRERISDLRPARPALTAGAAAAGTAAVGAAWYFARRRTARSV
jgi:HAD superfamily hydrolase (TIGR01490 family)